MTLDTTMEKAGGEMPRSLNQSFLATRHDSQGTLLSVHKWWSLRRSPRDRGPTRQMPWAEEGSPPSEEGKFSQEVLNGAQEIRASQVSAIAEGLESREWGWIWFIDGGFFHVLNMRGQGCGSGMGSKSMNIALRPNS